MESRRLSVAFTSVHWAASSSALLLLLSTSLLQIGDAEVFDCDLVCFSEYASASVRDCDLINYVIGCYYRYEQDCAVSDYAPGTISIVVNEHEVLGCDPVETTAPRVATTAPRVATTALRMATTAPRVVTTAPEEMTTAPVALTTERVTMTTPPPPPPPSCPKVPPYMQNIQSLASPTITPTTAANDCKEYGTRTLQQCSLFGLSTLRPFQSYRSGLEVCNIPGSWYLLRHRTMTVEVEGVTTGRNSDHTKLSKVNVTFYRSANCLGETKSYVVSLDDNSSLPQNFTDYFVPNNCSANLQLIINSDGTGVSLLATWINSTVVIRKHANHLGVTIQVPGHLAFESDGLCRGCPPHAYFNVSRFNNEASDHCEEENWAVLFLCFNGFSNRFSIYNASYADICSYHLWRGNTTSYEEYIFLLTISNDAELLSDLGQIPPRSFEIISLSNSPITEDLCHPTHQPNSSVTMRELTNTTDRIDTTTTDSTTQRVYFETDKPVLGASTIGASTIGASTISASLDHQRRSTTSLWIAAILTAFVVRLLHR